MRGGRGAAPSQRRCLWLCGASAVGQPRPAPWTSPQLPLGSGWARGWWPPCVLAATGWTFHGEPCSGSTSEATHEGTWLAAVRWACWKWSNNPLHPAGSCCAPWLSQWPRCAASLDTTTSGWPATGGPSLNSSSQGCAASSTGAMTPLVSPKCQGLKQP